MIFTFADGVDGDAFVVAELESVLEPLVASDTKVHVASASFTEWASFRTNPDADITIFPWGTPREAPEAGARRIVGENGLNYYDCVPIPDYGAVLPVYRLSGEDVIASSTSGAIVHNLPLPMIISNGHAPLVSLYQELIPVALSEDHPAVALLENENTVAEIHSMMSTSANERVDCLRSSIEDSIEKIAHHEAMVANLRRTLRDDQELVDAAISLRSSGATVAQVEREVMGIQRNAAIRAYTLSGTVLTLLTNPIEIESRDGDKTCALGPYTIKLDMSTNDVIVRNLHNRRGNFDHPHVRNGHFCSGGWESTLNGLMSRKEIAAAAAFVLACLGQVNHDDDWGRHSKWWFSEADERRAEMSGDGPVQAGALPF